MHKEAASSKGGSPLVGAKLPDVGDGERLSGDAVDLPAAEHAAPKAAAKHDPKAVPAFVPLDPFTVNLADRDAERYAQIGITLEIEDAKLADQIKNYMPAIRNNILMVLSHKTAGELLEREAIERLVVVERAHQLIAPRPDRALAVFLVAVGVGVARYVQPVARPAFAVVRRGEQAIHQLGVRIR